MRTANLSCPLLAVMALLLGSCAKEEGPLATMQASFEARFASACGADEPCQAAVEAHADSCFNRDLAQQALNAPPEASSRINGNHRLKYHECLVEASGKDYWAGKNLSAESLMPDSQ